MILAEYKGCEYTKIPMLPSDVKKRLQKAGSDEVEIAKVEVKSDSEDDSSVVRVEKTDSLKKKGKGGDKKKSPPMKKTPKQTAAEKQKLKQEQDKERNTGSYPLYCARCLTKGSKNLGSFRCARIATVRIFLMEDLLCKEVERSDRKEAPLPIVVGMVVEELIPHNSQCHFENAEDKRNYLFNKEQAHGSGHCLSTFPQDAIFGDTFHKVTAAMNMWRIDDPFPPGWDIEFLVAEDKGKKYDKELRKYVVVPTKVEWWKNLVLPSKLRTTGVKLMLYCANFFNAQHEYVDWAHDQLWPELANRIMPDKMIQNISPLYGGLPKLDEGITWSEIVARKKNEPKVYNQPMHCNISASVDKDTGELYSVSQNPKLVGKSKPGSLIFSIQDSHTILIQGGKEKPINVIPNKMLFIAGDGVHTGKTCGPDNLGMHCSIYCTINSTEHPWNDEELDLDVAAFATSSAYHADRLDAKGKTDVMNYLADHTETFLEATFDGKVPNPLLDRAKQFHEKLGEWVRAAEQGKQEEKEQSKKKAAAKATKSDEVDRKRKEPPSRSPEPQPPL